MLLGIRDVFGDFAHGHIVQVGRAEQIENVLYPTGHGSTAEIGIIVGHKQQNGRGNAAAQTVVGRGVNIQQKRIESAFQKRDILNAQLGVQRSGRI